MELNRYPNWTAEVISEKEPTTILSLLQEITFTPTTAPSKICGS
jgi:hypothetical protein